MRGAPLDLRPVQPLIERTVSSLHPREIANLLRIAREDLEGARSLS